MKVKMTDMIRKYPGLSIAIVLGVILVSVAAFALGSRDAGDSQARELVLIAKDLAFYETGKTQPNPDLVFKKGETVRLVIVNEEPGKILHCFTLAGLDIKTSNHLEFGQSETLIVTPKKKGEFGYSCMLHPLMSGKVVVN